MAHELRTVVMAVLGEEFAQDAFDYLLTGGIIAVAFALALLAFDEVIPAVVGHACPGIDTAGPSAVGSCLTPTPTP